MRIYKSWEDLKTIKDLKKLVLQYEDCGDYYYIWVEEKNTIYWTEIEITDTANDDQLDFENNYKSGANTAADPKSDDGKVMLRSESRPIGHTTCFVGAGDSDNGIGDGKVLSWDFSNTEDEVIMPSGSTERRKRIEFKFLDPVYIKEGTIYYHNVPKGAYIDLYVVCPANNYYYDNDGNLQLASEDTPIAHYVIHHPIQGTVELGDELNTESCSSEIPANYKFWIEITTLADDTLSNGHVSLELYRKRTVIL